MLNLPSPTRRVRRSSTREDVASNAIVKRIHGNTPESWFIRQANLSGVSLNTLEKVHDTLVDAQISSYRISWESVFSLFRVTQNHEIVTLAYLAGITQKDLFVMMKRSDFSIEMLKTLVGLSRADDMAGVQTEMNGGKKDFKDSLSEARHRMR